MLSEYNMHIRYSHSTFSHKAVDGVHELHVLQLLQRVTVKRRLKATSILYAEKSTQLQHTTPLKSKSRDSLKDIFVAVMQISSRFFQLQSFI